MEGVFSFFLESAFLGLFLYGERRLSRRGHWWAAFAVFAGSRLSDYFIIVTDAWMQYPVAFTRTADGIFQVTSFWGLLLNPWALIQYVLPSQFVHRCPKASTGRAELVLLDFDRDCL